MRAVGYIYGIIISIILVTGCSTVRYVRPIEKGTSAASLSLGGPVTQVSGNYLPLPLLSAGYGYGVTDYLSLEAALHITSALFGVAHVDIGANWVPLATRGVIPGVVLSPKVVLLSNFKPHESRSYPVLTPTLYWERGRHLWYTGVENWFERHSVRADGNEQSHHWLIIPYIGYGIAKGKWQFQAEGRVYMPNLSNTPGATTNLGFGDRGIIGFFLGVNRTFGGGAK